mmetsp:Transcript_12402/g.37129  ORF Transcript_12402/g.37129 Transcript_12402/m.37129 type:complete len:855 (+) Transcript_12402:45-2609(+)
MRNQSSAHAGQSSSDRIRAMLKSKDFSTLSTNNSESTSTHSQKVSANVGQVGGDVESAPSGSLVASSLPDRASVMGGGRHLDPREPSLPHDFDSNVQDMPELRRTWRGSFSDAEVEEAYHAEVFYPQVGVCMSNVLLMLAAFNCTSLVTLAHSGIADGLSVERHGWSANLLIIVLFVQCAFIFRSELLCQIPKPLLEPIAICVLVGLAIFLRFHQALVPSIACQSNVTLMLRLGTFSAIVCAYVPLTVPSYSIVAAVSIAIAGALDWWIPDQGGWCPLNIVSLAALGLALVLCRHKLAMHSRGEWAFRRTVIVAQRERRRVHRQFENSRSIWLKEVRAGEKLAEKAHLADEGKNARSRMIRVVMHDLRSPLLAVRATAELMSAGPMVWEDGGSDEHGGTQVLAPSRGQSSSARASSRNSSGFNPRQSITVLNTCTELMENIVSDMLDFERIDSGRMQLVPAPFSIATLLHDGVSCFESTASQRGISLAVEPLTREIESAVFVGDRRRLLQALGNGLSNAIKFSRRGQLVRISTSMLASARDLGEGALSTVRITVLDQGEGISAEELAVLRKGDAFAQVGRGQLQGNGGTGLGLNIARSILALHNQSQLHIASSGHGQGTTFQMDLHLPRTHEQPETSDNGLEAVRAKARASLGSSHISNLIAPASDGGAPDEHTPPSAAPPDSPWRDAGMRARVYAYEAPTSNSSGAASARDQEGDGPALVRCLHAEDDAMLRLALGARLFDRTDVVCDTVENGRAAVDLVARRKAEEGATYDLILMDNQMPLLTGDAATRELRASGFTGKIVGMTGDPIGSQDRASFDEAGLDKCVDKTPEGIQAVKDEIDRLAALHLPRAWP